MKPFINISIGFLVITFLCGCPFNSPHAIDEQPQQYVDEALLGKWATMVTRVISDRVEKQNPIKIIISKRTDMEYNIAITGYLDDIKPWIHIEEDTLKGTAFLSTVADRQFINVNIQCRNYIAEVKNKNGSLSIFPMSDGFTAKFIKNSASLRMALYVHFKTRPYPSYDDAFILTDLVKVN